MHANYGILYEEVFGESPIASITVAPNLTVKVKDRITGSVLKGAIVKVNTEEMTTDAKGLAIFGELPPGKYTISVGKSGYKSWLKTVSFKLGEVINISLWPWWAIGAGAAGGIGIAIILIERFTRPKRG